MNKLETLIACLPDAPDGRARMKIEEHAAPADAPAQIGVSIMRSDLRFCSGDDCPRAYYVKGHVPLDEFMSVLNQEVTDDDMILKEDPVHCWMRICRDFEERRQIIVEAKPGSKGAFRTTWIQEN